MLSPSMLFKTNLLVCLVIIVGFSVTSIIGHKARQNEYMDNIEQISTLTSEGIRHRLESVFAKPVNVSMAMAASPLLRSSLLTETGLEGEDFIQIAQNYLNTYKEEYGYDSVFLVSTKTGRYYNSKGVDRLLNVSDPENEWYYSFLKANEDCSLNVDNDQAAQNEITIFVNCRIKDDNGTTLGVVGVGFRFYDLQNLLMDYAREYNADIYVINTNGDIEAAIDNNGYQPVNFFDVCSYPQLKEEILHNNNPRETLTWWVTEHYMRNYIAAQYIPELNWHLIVENNTTQLEEQIKRQNFRTITVALITGLFVFIAITYTLNRYNKRIIMLTASIEREKQAAFRNATEQLFDNIYEFNITKNRTIGNDARQYFEGYGMTDDTPYDKALTVIAGKSVKEEYRDGYIFTFSPENVLHEFKKGNTGLEYDFLCTDGGAEYYWIRIMAHIYYSSEDDSVCMFTYCKNIDEQKRKEAMLSEQAQLDGLTNIYNKSATEHHIEQMLSATKEKDFAFFIIDIDNFKQINDGYGHAFGDLVIKRFAEIIKDSFRSVDIIGRIGGDEFVVFLSVPGKEWANKKAAELSKELNAEVVADGNCCKISASIGVSIISKGGTDFNTLYQNADIALYKTKRRGKNGFSVYGNFN